MSLKDLGNNLLAKGLSKGIENLPFYLDTSVARTEQAQVRSRQNSMGSLAHLVGTGFRGRKIEEWTSHGSAVVLTHRGAYIQIHVRGFGGWQGSWRIMGRLNWASPGVLVVYADCSIGVRSPRPSASPLFCVERISFSVFDESMYEIWKNVLASEYKRGKKR